MIRHIVLFGVHPHISDAECDAVLDALRALPDAIPEIRLYEVARDEVGGARSATFGVLSHFDDFAALDRYRNHPDHQAVLVRLNEISAWIKAWDYTVVPESPSL